MKRLVVSAMAAACVLCGSALAEMDWSAQRSAQFAIWHKAHTDIESRIAALKKQTADFMARRSPDAGAFVYRVKGAPKDVWDDPVAPRMTVVPAGEFLMGSPESEADRRREEGPQHRVRIAYPFAVSTYQVTRAEYAAFVADTRRPDGESCFLTYAPNQTGETKGYSWRNPGFAQTGRDPVVCVSWQDARAYAGWLSAKTGKRYRLLSEAEWEYASRAGTSTSRFWGDGIGRGNANYGKDECCGPAAAGIDRWPYTSPGGSFPPNAFGLYDMLGNAWAAGGRLLERKLRGRASRRFRLADGRLQQAHRPRRRLRLDPVLSALGLPRLGAERRTLCRRHLPHRPRSVGGARSAA